MGEWYGMVGGVEGRDRLGGWLMWRHIALVLVIHNSLEKMWLLLLFLYH